MRCREQSWMDKQTVDLMLNNRRAVSLKKYKELPKYTFYKKTGPHHSPLFKAEVKIPNSKKFNANGNSKKDKTDPNEIRELLVQQVTGRVRWRESVLFMKDNGVDTFVEVGTGKVLSGLTRRIDRELISTSIQGPNDIDGFLGSI